MHFLTATVAIFAIVPRKLSRRKRATACIVHILCELVDSVIAHAVTRQRTRRRIVRNACAARIQQIFRSHKAHRLANAQHAEWLTRRAAVDRYFNKLCLVVFVGLRIYRWMRIVMRRKRRTGRHETCLKSSVKVVTVRQVLSTVLMRIHEILASNKRRDELKQVMDNLLVAHSLHHQKTRLEVLQLFNSSTERIQTAVRGMIARDRVKDMKALRGKKEIVYAFLRRFLARVRAGLLLTAAVAATAIQRRVRGALLRMSILKQIKARSLLVSQWLRHKMSKSLKQHLRSIDKPVTIVLRGMRNIPHPLLTLTGRQGIMVKVSIFWTGKLHFVKGNDIDDVARAHGPNMVFTTHLFPTQLDDARQMSGGQMIDGQMSGGQMIDGQMSDAFEWQQRSRDSDAAASARTPDMDSSDLRPHAPKFPGRKYSSTPVGELRTTTAEKLQVLQSSGIPSSLAAVAPSSVPRTIAYHANDRRDEQERGGWIAALDKEEKTESQPSKTVHGSLQRRMSSAFELAGILLTSGALLKFGSSDGGSDSDGDGDGDGDGAARSHSCSEVTEDDGFGVQRKVVTRSKFSMFPWPLSNSAQSKAVGAVNKLPPVLSATADSVTGSSPMSRGSSRSLYSCNFGDVELQIPGCHGNSVFLFEFSNGERKIGSHSFYMATEGTWLYWGGDYVNTIKSNSSGRRASGLFTNMRARDNKQVGVKFEYRVLVGRPLMSRAQWGHVIFKGYGPVWRAFRERDTLATALGRWQRVYLSLNGNELGFYAGKADVAAVASISTKTFSAMKTQAGKSRMGKREKIHAMGREDLVDLILITKNLDEFRIRFSSSVSRILWEEAVKRCLACSNRSCPPF